MDFHLKQWPADHHHHHENPSSIALPLFSSEPTSSSTKPSKMMQNGYFSMGQWQELEVQALIYRHMLTGSPVPPQLLHLLLNSNSNTNPNSPFYTLSTFPPLYQNGGGYWGRGGMDLEPGRCRRTDGKKWRCSRDVVAGHKYCERHVHRGRNRSRKPVEVPTPTTATAGGGSRGDDYGCGLKKPMSSYTTPTTTHGAPPYATVGGGGSGHSAFFDQLHLNQRISESTMNNKGTYNSSHNETSEANKSSGDRTLRPFFNDWPRTVHEQEMLATSLSISVTCDAPSDFSLKLATGNGNTNPHREEFNGERDRVSSNWGMLWGTHHASSMGGPLAEALRSSSTSNASSPTSVIRGSMTTSETSYVTT